MRNRLFSLMLTVAAMFTSLAFTSCGSDDNGEPEVPDTYSAKVDYSATFTDDMIRLLDIAISYYDPSAGKEVTEKVTKAGWTKSYNVTKLPAKAYLLVKLTQKTDEKVAETFKYSRSYEVLVTRYKNNKEDDFKESSIHSSGTMAADKFPTFLEKYCAETPFMKSSTITVSADGLSEE